MRESETPKEIIETSLGKLWVEDQANGDMRVWWPYGARAGELAMGVLRGRSQWDPRSHGWYVFARYRDAGYEELQEL